MTTKPLIDLAVQARVRGFNLIPLKGNESNDPEEYKRPLISWQKYQTQLATITEIRDWNKQWPKMSYGVVTGSVSKLFVFDLDSDEALSAAESRGLGGGLVVDTKKGKHVYYRWIDALNTKVTTATAVIPGADVRGEGGYVVAWDLEAVLSKPLVPPPDWLVEMLAPKQRSIEVGSKDWVSQALEGLNQGNRNDTFARVAGKLWRGGLDKDAIRTLLVPHCNRVGFSLGELESVLTSIARYEREEQATVRDFTNSIEDYKKRLGDRSHFKEPELSTGYPSIDSATWGLRRGDIVTIGARPGVGKTCLCLAIAHNLCVQGRRVMYVSTEMSYDQIFDRFISIDANVNAFHLHTGQLDHDDKIGLDLFYAKASTYDFHIFDGFHPSLDSIKDLMLEVKPDVVIIDHLQHMASKTSEGSVKELDVFTRGLKAIGREFNAAMVVASQLNRSIQFDEDGARPQLHHLKGCGTIEEESAQVILMSKASGEDEDSATVMCELAKNRFGSTAFFELRLVKKYVRFEEVL